jgi:hypothetical protein
MKPGNEKSRTKEDAELSKEAERRERIATEAYYIAQRRGFHAGNEIEDWLEAERRINGEASEPALSAPRPININVREEIRGRDRPSPLDAGLPDEPDARIERRRTRRVA